MYVACRCNAACYRLSSPPPPLPLAQPSLRAAKALTAQTFVQSRACPLRNHSLQGTEPGCALTHSLTHSLLSERHAGVRRASAEGRRIAVGMDCAALCGQRGHGGRHREAALAQQTADGRADGMRVSAEALCIRHRHRDHAGHAPYDIATCAVRHLQHASTHVATCAVRHCNMRRTHVTTCAVRHCNMRRTTLQHASYDIATCAASISAFPPVCRASCDRRRLVGRGARVDLPDRLYNLTPAHLAVRR